MRCLGWLLVAVMGALLGGCRIAVGDAGSSGGMPGGPVSAVCDNAVAGPAVAPAGAVVVDPAVQNALADQTERYPPGTTFWLAPGVHTLESADYGQIVPKDGNSYIGAPGAVLDGREINTFAFTGKASGVTVAHLTVSGFVGAIQEGVVNHDFGEDWTVEHNTIEENGGAGMMAGVRSQIRYNCLRNNGQYAINAFGSDLVVEGNEIVGNNADDLENTIEGGCGCTGGVKFWNVDGADVRGNWVHDNRGVGLWIDMDNNDFLIEGNLIEDNDAEAVFYEVSYNLVLRDNLIRNNAYVKGREFADRNDTFPVGAIYISESGGEPRLAARTDRIEIYGNVLANNWSGITAWENADRFCNNTPENAAGGYCTLLVEPVSACAVPAITQPPLIDDCRWKTQRVDIHDNTFLHDPAVVGCEQDMAGLMAMFSNVGTQPAWSPYLGRTVQEAITFEQDNVWRDNTYLGPWGFMVFEAGTEVATDVWRAAPYRQDAGSTFADDTSGRC